MEAILTPVIVLSLMGVVVAVLLGFASQAFAVPVDPKVAAIEEALPGINCGACGYPGCAGCAAAIAAGEAPVNACVVGGEATADVVADIMGTDADSSTKMVASVQCRGTCDNVSEIYEYDGQQNCTIMAYSFGGNKSCSFACIGCGDCQDVCEFDAIRMVDGVSVIDKDKCTACMQCINTCPKHVIELVPYDAPAQINCSNPKFGKDVSANCKIGCIGCGVCTKLAPESFQLDGKLARPTYNEAYDLDKIKQAAEKCPAKCINVNPDAKEGAAVQEELVEEVEA